MRTLAYAVALGAAVGAVPAAAQRVHVATTGDQNMVTYIDNFLAPMFERANPGVKVFSIGTGFGDAGALKIYEKLAAQKLAGVDKWDFDVIVIQQKMAGRMVQENLLAAYKDKIPTGGLVSRDTGADVAGYVMPMFRAQTAIAYNASLVHDAPNSYAELVEWVKKTPKKFGYNGVKHGMAGAAFVTGWIYAFGGDADRLVQGPYDATTKARWDEALADLKEFNANVVVTPSDAGSLDQLSRGEIVMAPVWAEMFFSMKAQGKLPPDMKLKLLAPGMPGQSMYYAIPARAENAATAEKFIALATSPEVQAEGIVKRFNWYPGIDARHLEGKLDDAAWSTFFSDISPAELAAKGKPFPLGQYLNDILEAYQKKVEN